MNRREAILEGTLAAQRLHAQLRTQSLFQNVEAAGIDVFRVAIDMGATLLFRPLKGLLGAYLGKPYYPAPGILISTQRELHVQRFTAAHELGHLALGHKMPSLDEQVGLWRGEKRDLDEVAADAFASEFLLPRWLFIMHARRHQWDSNALKKPENVYQLSLRLGASYEATCWGLVGHDIIDQPSADNLRSIAPKSIKQTVVGDLAILASPWANVWILTEHDSGANYEGGPDDVVICQFREHAAAGYLWDESGLPESGLELVTDTRQSCVTDSCGDSVDRRLVARARGAARYSISLVQRRPWCPDDVAAKLSLNLSLLGKEVGLPRTLREMMVAA